MTLLVKPTLVFYPKLIVVLKSGTDKVDRMAMNEKFLHERKIAHLVLRINCFFKTIKNINPF